MQVAKVICPICGQEISKSNFVRHQKRHENHPETFEKSVYRVDHEGLNCKFCGKECKSKKSLAQHELRCKNNPDRKDYIKEGFNSVGSKTWNKGLTKETDERMKLIVEKYVKNEKLGLHKSHTHPHTDETKKHLSIVMTEYNHSNNRRNSHGKHGYFDGIYFMSTWELAFYIFSKSHGHNIIRCSERFRYELNGKYHYYTPDFIEDDTFIEVKGWETDLDKIKYEVVDNLKVIYYNDIKPMIDYVKKLYQVENLDELYTGD